jgi:hypothetical protein
MGLAQRRGVRNAAASEFGQADIPGRAAIRAEAAIEARSLAGAVIAGNLPAIHRRAFAIRATRAGWKTAAIGAQGVPVRAAELFKVTNARATGAIATLDVACAACGAADRAHGANAL